jgi:hypothetical protein
LFDGFDEERTDTLGSVDVPAIAGVTRRPRNTAKPKPKPKPPAKKDVHPSGDPEDEDIPDASPDPERERGQYGK